MIQEGIVVLDSGVLDYLRAENCLRTARSNARVAALRIMPSIINYLEIMKHGNAIWREELVGKLREWLGESALLPWPPQLLRAAGLAAIDGLSEFEIPADELFTLADGVEPADADHSEATEFLTRFEASFRAAHAKAVPALNQLIKKRGLRDQLQDASVFLDEIWGSKENMQHQAQLVWDALQLPCEAPNQIWHVSEPWKVMLEALGAAVFFRAIRKRTQGNPAGLADLFQMTYLTENTRSRTLVTDDKALFETADAVLVGRYGNVKVVSGVDFFGAPISN